MALFLKNEIHAFSLKELGEGSSGSAGSAGTAGSAGSAGSSGLTYASSGSSGSAGSAGSSGRDGGSFTHIQSSASLVWLINHNLNIRPVNIVVTDDNYNVIFPESIQYIDSNYVKVIFTSAQAGYAAIT